MNIDVIYATETELERFKEKLANYYKEHNKHPSIEYGSKEGAALRRASMDLTRALAKMRNS
jgi:hypothetical protein